MTQFKIGDRIKETFSENGSTGVIVSKHAEQADSWWILWDDTSEFPGEKLWLYEQDAELLPATTKFKIGDRVKEISTGDRGVVSEPKEYWDGIFGWWIDWKTGVETGNRLHLREEQMEHDNTQDIDGETITISGVQYKLIKV